MDKGHANTCTRRKQATHMHAHRTNERLPGVNQSAIGLCRDAMMAPRASTWVMSRHRILVNVGPMTSTRPWTVGARRGEAALAT
eukprot:scaffold8023_cov28-Tisochrysis_lutea.AAC.1